MVSSTALQRIAHPLQCDTLFARPNKRVVTVTQLVFRDFWATANSTGLSASALEMFTRYACVVRGNDQSRFILRPNVCCACVLFQVVHRRYVRPYYLHSGSQFGLDILRLAGQVFDVTHKLRTSRKRQTNVAT